MALESNNDWRRVKFSTLQGYLLYNLCLHEFLAVLFCHGSEAERYEVVPTNIFVSNMLCVVFQ